MEHIIIFRIDENGNPYKVTLDSNFAKVAAEKGMKFEFHNSKRGDVKYEARLMKFILCYLREKILLKHCI